LPSLSIQSDDRVLNYTNFSFHSFDAVSCQVKMTYYMNLQYKSLNIISSETLVS